jgi:hypothetical protein
VEQLLEAGMMVYPINPKSAKAYRERKAPSGVKDDRLDAWSFADALRLDGQDWKALKPEEPLIKELRLLCRDEVSLIEQRTAFIQQLRHALAEYYPVALEAFKDWTSVQPAQTLCSSVITVWPSLLQTFFWHADSHGLATRIQRHVVAATGETKGTIQSAVWPV